MEKGRSYWKRPVLPVDRREVACDGVASARLGSATPGKLDKRCDVFGGFNDAGSYDIECAVCVAGERMLERHT